MTSIVQKYQKIAIYKVFINFYRCNSLTYCYCEHTN